MRCERYAIWWVPQRDSRLALFGQAWTGWCPERGSLHRGGELGRFARTHANLPLALSLGGLHAPFGTSFRLAEGRSPWALERAVTELSARMPAISLPALRLENCNNRVRLTFGREPALAHLVDEIAATVRPLRMIACHPRMEEGAAENGGKALDGETPRTARFGIWLTGTTSAADQIMAELQPVLAPILAEPVTISDLSLVCDPGGNRPWRVLERFELQGGVETSRRAMPSGMDCFGPSLFTPLVALAGAFA